MQEFPKMLYRGLTTTVVADNTEEALAREDGFGDFAENQESPTVTDAETADATAGLAAQIVEQAELIEKLDAAGAAVAQERDELKATLEAVRAENAELKAVINKFDGNGDGKPGGSKPKGAA